MFAHTFDRARGFVFVHTRRHTKRLTGLLLHFCAEVGIDVRVRVSAHGYIPVSIHANMHDDIHVRSTVLQAQARAQTCAVPHIQTHAHLYPFPHDAVAIIPRTTQPPIQNTRVRNSTRPNSVKLEALKQLERSQPNFAAVPLLLPGVPVTCAATSFS